MDVVHEIAGMQRRAAEARLARKTIAVVPTMGALHAGHAALIREARSRADLVITTVFVNPTQFGPGEDFARYPRSPERDALCAAKAGSDILFAPEGAAMYPAGYSTFVEVAGITDVLEGRARPGHFRGVATIVAKLFLITSPHIAVFGQKDAQQVAVIRRLIADLNYPIDLIVVPIVRDADGVALSSRNAYLTPAQRREATVLHRSLQRAEACVREGERDSAAVIAEMRSLIAGGSGGDVEYISIADAATLQEQASIRTGTTILISLAVRFGHTRLIDNCIVEV